MTDIEKMAREAVDQFTSPHYEYGEHRPVESYSLAKWVAKAVAERCAEICRTTDLFVDEWKAGHKCADAIREEFGLEETP